MKRTNEEIYNSCINLMLENNFNDNDISNFTKSVSDERIFLTNICANPNDILVKKEIEKRLRKILKSNERYYRSHYRLGKNIFTICKKSDNYYGNYRGYSNIYEAYERPSIYKVRIWEEWEEELRPYYLSIYIPSRNGFQFTIAGELILPTTGEIVPYYITKTRQEIYL